MPRVKPLRANRKSAVNKVVSVRLSPQARVALESFAANNNLPNISAAARVVIEMALTRGVDEGAYRVAEQNVRAEWIERIREGWQMAMKTLTEIGLRE